MGWAAFTVAAPDTGDLIAAQLLELANDPLTWSLSNLGATVIRRRIEGSDRFYFSPHAVGLFDKVIAAHSGAPCDPPRARELVPAHTSRMLLGFKTRWEPFQAARIPAKGIPRMKPQTNGGKA